MLNDISAKLKLQESDPRKALECQGDGLVLKLQEMRDLRSVLRNFGQGESIAGRLLEFDKYLREKGQKLAVMVGGNRLVKIGSELDFRQRLLEKLRDATDHQNNAMTHHERSSAIP